MGKKEKIEFTRSDALQEIDADLEEAMNSLDETNDRVDDVLIRIEEGVDLQHPGEGDDASDAEQQDTSQETTAIADPDAVTDFSGEEATSEDEEEYEDDDDQEDEEED